jgi:hypothetical protein
MSSISYRIFKRQIELDAEIERSKYDNDLKRMQIVHDALKEQVNDIYYHYTHLCCLV